VDRILEVLMLMAIGDRLSYAVIPSLFSLSALELHLGIQMCSLNAEIACFNKLTPIVLMLVRMPILCRSARIYVGNIPIARRRMGGRNVRLVLLVTGGKN